MLPNDTHQDAGFLLKEDDAAHLLSLSIRALWPWTLDMSWGAVCWMRASEAVYVSWFRYLRFVKATRETIVLLIDADLAADSLGLTKGFTQLNKGHIEQQYEDKVVACFHSEHPHAVKVEVLVKKPGPEGDGGGSVSSPPMSRRPAPLSFTDFFLMSQIFDLFGDPLPENWGERGLPEHIATRQNRNRVRMLAAFVWSNRRIAAALLVTQPTLRKHYFSSPPFCAGAATVSMLARLANITLRNRPRAGGIKSLANSGPDRQVHDPFFYAKSRKHFFRATP